MSLKNIINKEKIKKIDLVKIDTEGHELQVLQGAGNFLKKGIKYLIIEFHNSNIFLNYNPVEIEKYLKKNGFILKKDLSFHLLRGKIEFILIKKIKK